MVYCLTPKADLGATVSAGNKKYRKEKEKKNRCGSPRLKMKGENDQHINVKGQTN